MSRLLGVLLLAVVCDGAYADEGAVRKFFEGKFPQGKIQSVTRTVYGGLYEVYMDGRLHYTDDKTTFIMVGELIDTKTNQNVTEQRMRRLTALNLKELPPPDMAIRRVKGNGKRQLTVFSDPMCPFCKRLELELSKLNNVTINVFLYPVEQKFPGTTELAKSIWCAPDRAKAWDEWMLKGQRPAGKGTCATPIEQIDKIGGKLSITATPTVIFGDGAPVNGFLSAVDLDRLMGQ